MQWSAAGEVRQTGKTVKCMLQSDISLEWIKEGRQEEYICVMQAN